MLMLYMHMKYVAILLRKEFLILFYDIEIWQFLKGRFKYVYIYVDILTVTWKFVLTP